MTIVGFEQNQDNGTREYLPPSTQIEDNHGRRQLFMHLFNAYVDEDIRFSKDEMRNGSNLYEIFQNKISNLSTLPAQASKLTRFIQGDNKYKLLCDMDDMFLHLVFERAKLVNRKNQVLLFDKTIVIKNHRSEVSSTLLIPAYTMIDKQNLYHEPIIAEHLKTVLSTLEETEIRQIYLVYPKHSEFKRHISLKLLDKIPLKEDEYRVKVIPYSFSFCIKNQNNTTYTRRQKNVNRNFLR